MEVLRTYDGYSLNVGDGMGKGLFNVSDKDNDVSLWFDWQTKNVLMAMSDEAFATECQTLIAYANSL